MANTTFTIVKNIGILSENYNGYLKFKVESSKINPSKILNFKVEGLC